MRLVVVNHLTLDGVVQGPGRGDEDTRGGFAHGGWAGPGSHEALQEATGRRFGSPADALLLGRRSYEDMLGHWNEAGGPFKQALNATRKYVASRDEETELEWPSSTLVSGDVPAAVAELKRGEGRNLVIMGSGELIRSLLPHGLIDEYLLMVHPLLLGCGQRLFGASEEPVRLRLLESATAPTGVLIAAYAPA